MTKAGSPAPADLPALEMSGITKHFGDLEALSSVSFSLRRGTLHALLGENGAGKTTLMRIAFGMISSDMGDIRVHGVPSRIRTPHDAIGLGIGMVHQHFMLVPAMTVAENVELGQHGRYDAGDAARKLQLLEARTGLSLDPSAKVSSLTVAAQQRLEIIKALAQDAQVLILDEPTAVLAPAEAQNLLAQIRKLVLDGISVVLITHKLRDAQQYADDVSVLRRGRLVLTGLMSGFTEREVAAAMLGHDPSPPEARTGSSPSIIGESIIRLKGVGLIDAGGVRRLGQVNLDIRAGEIVGIAALEGNAAVLLRVLAGRSTPTEGECILPDRIGFIPEDRQNDALVPMFTLQENVALKGSSTRRGRVPWPRIKDQALSLIREFDVRASGADMRAQNLSGGNQQKLILGRELSDRPLALIAENPTRGLDISASAMIHERLRQARETGCAIVFYSSDIDELVDLADRVLILREGALSAAPRDAKSIGNMLLAGLSISQ